MSYESRKATLLDLPAELILLIFPYLDAASFLSLTSTCRALHNPEFTTDSAYWSALVRRDFRVPNQPVAQSDGRRWQRLYKRLRTQTRVFTWGNDDKGSLGQTFEDAISAAHILPAMRRMPFRRRRQPRPGMMEGAEALGIVSDLQCGGWSTTMLTSKGDLYAVGVLDGQWITSREPYNQQPKTSPTPLRFPPGLPHPRDRYDPATAITQFSSGRAHVLGLSDSGQIWSWNNIDFPGTHVKFVHHETKEDGRGAGRGTVKKVVAGWNKSAALIEGSGIVVWEPLQLDPHECDSTDAALVLESAVVSRTSYSKSASGEDEDDIIGEVKNFILLEACVLFNTSLGKLFAAQVIWEDSIQTISQPIELSVPKYGSADATATSVTDVQGSFRNFAVFTESGAVLTSNQDRLMSLLTNQQSNQRLFQRIPALQNKGVISLAFGDYHYHALHSAGHITSYGNEPQTCGALGLGGRGIPESRLRGIRHRGIGGDARLVPHAYTEGRRVWFEDVKQEWITFLTSGGVDSREAAERLRMTIGSPGITAQGELSEWIEQEGRDWEGKYGIRQEGDDSDSLGAYFALSVTAAGFHSAALVLVNEDMAERLRRAVESPDHDNGEDDAETELIESAAEISQAVAASSSTTSFWDRATDFGRYFLGLAPYNVNSAAYDPNASHLRSNTTNTGNASHHEPQPSSYGASPRKGFHYVWANDHFPRLRLSDGTEMPGDVAFDEWRYGRPEWHLNWEDDNDE